VAGFSDSTPGRRHRRCCVHLGPGRWTRPRPRPPMRRPRPRPRPRPRRPCPRCRGGSRRRRRGKSRVELVVLIFFSPYFIIHEVACFTNMKQSEICTIY
jgi:hypothetical protein